MVGQPIPSNGNKPPSQAALVYLPDVVPGIRRKKAGEGFRYLDTEGRPLRDEATLARIRRLAVPPAWTDVWISPEPNGHIQATGRDAKGRKQYRYHPRWREERDESKFERTIAFAQALPGIRARVEADLAKRGLSREKVLATVVRLLEDTHVRVGNREYARDNDSFGLTTLRDRHVDIDGDQLRFEFRGKSGRMLTVGLKDRRLARIVRQCRDIKGYELFQYLDEDGNRCRVDAEDVNDYIREVAGCEFSTKDFRTWRATVLASQGLAELEPIENAVEHKKRLAGVVETVAKCLGNTPQVCRISYIHPDVIDSYTGGSFADLWRSTRAGKARKGLSREETAVLRLLKQERDRA